MSDFWDLVNIEEFWEKRNYFETERWEISFYCKDCEAIVETERKKPKQYIFSCSKCEGTNIAIWTAAGLKENYFRKKF
jgi:Zn finger protein HypA/HybF involved in hydrogenase expression